jgi:hypothetical protein
MMDKWFLCFLIFHKNKEFLLERGPLSINRVFAKKQFFFQ